MDEGYIKFQAHWRNSPPYSAPGVTALIHWRQACYNKGWIGMYKNGIGYGNISIRVGDENKFLITGSATGGIAQLSAEHLAMVDQVKAPQNELWCSGPIVASSESMSHAAIYDQLPWVGGVIHIHHLAFWQAALHQVPTTAADAAYGTPAMVASIHNLLKRTALPSSKLFVMEGHEEGVFAFGHDLAEAFQVLEAAFAEIIGDS